MKRQRKNSGLFNDMDITQALDGWAFEPGQVNVRLIRGNDGRAKLQLRLDLGLLQMEIEGRPDGKRPHRAATELDFQKRKLTLHRNKHGSDKGFALTPQQCQLLREESAMFYHRYLSMFVLEQYEAVVRDTQHNMDVLDLCRRYGRSEFDRNCLEQYRPYIIMMQTRAKGCEALRQGYVRTAIAYLRGGIKSIAALLPREHRRKMLRQSHEAHILLDMLRQIRAQLPPDPRTALRKKLREALAAERYEQAAVLRDQLAAASAAMKPGAAAKEKTAGESGTARSPARRARKGRTRKVEDSGDKPSPET